MLTVYAIRRANLRDTTRQWGDPTSVALIVIALNLAHLLD